MGDVVIFTFPFLLSQGTYTYVNQAMSDPLDLKYE